MELNQRKIKILQAIIQDYIQTAEPVGSRTISKKYDIGISSATIRNEMSDLEEMGFILQPHASAGRIPSDMGYRLYVDKLMHHKELKEDDSILIHNIIQKNVDQIDFLMRETAKIITELTNYTTIVSEPITTHTKIKQLNILKIEDNQALLIVITDDNMVKNKVIKFDFSLNGENLTTISNVLNSHFKGTLLEEITPSMIELCKNDLGDYHLVIKYVIELFSEIVRNAREANIHLSGTNKILAFPEFSDIEKAKNIFKALEEKQTLIDLLNHASDESVSIIIGKENSAEDLKNLSIVTTSYRFSDSMHGNIGIIGPTRMDYSQAVTILTTISKNIESVLKLLQGG